MTSVFAVDVRRLSGFLDQTGTEETIGLNYVISAAIAAGHDVSVVTFHDQRTIDEILAEVNQVRPRVLALGLDSCLVPTGAELVRRAREDDPELISVVGGSHFLSGRVEAPFDIAVIGEGEETFVELLQHLDRGADLHQVRGISFFDGDAVVTTPRRPRIRDLDGLPYPHRTADVTKNRLRGFIYPREEAQLGYASISPSRGCAYDCSFCTSTTQWGRGAGSVRYRSVESVVAEVEYVQERFGTNLVYFADLNFTARPRWVKALCRALLARPDRPHWYAMANISTSRDPELLPLMGEAGCVEILWGIESVSDHVVERKLREREVVEEVLQRTLESGIVNHGSIIIGFPADTEETIRDSIPIIISLPLHCIRVSVCVPFPGTRMASQCEIIDHDLRHHDLNHLVYRHPRLREEDVQRLKQEIYDAFYGSSEHLQRLEDFKRRRGLDEIGSP